MKKLHWGLLSTARINRNLIPALRASPRNELSAVASRDLARARDYAHEWKIPGAYGSYEELINDPNIDVIYNSLPNHLHAEWTVKAVQAGKHVLCEKPLALTLAEVDQVNDAAKQAGVTVVEAFMYRHHPMTLKVRELIERGTLGDIRYMRGTFSFVLNQQGNIRWLPETGGGSLWDIGCYPVSYARLVMGKAPITVFAAQVLGESGVDLSLTGQLDYGNGAFAQVESSFALPYYTNIEIRGTEAALIVPTPFNPKQHLTRLILMHGDDQEEISFDFPFLYLGEVEDLADVILTGKNPRLPLSESREIIATLLALYQSARQNLPVKVVT